MNGLSDHRHVTWLELFYDLAYVAVVAQLALFLHHPTGEIFWKFILLFFLIWGTWASHTMFSNWFEKDDMYHRLLTFVQMLAALGMGVYLKTAFDAGANGFIISYLVARVALLALFLRETKKFTMPLTLFSIAAVIWFASIFTSAPVRFYLWGVAVAIYFITPFFGRELTRRNIDNMHLPERFGLFAILVLGESMIALLLSISKISFTLTNVLAILSGYVLILLIWWLYFGFVDKCIVGKLKGNAIEYIYSHLPLYTGLIALAVGIEQIITENASSWLALTGFLLFFIAFNILRFTTYPEKDSRYTRFFIFVLIVGGLFFLDPLPALASLTVLFGIYLKIEKKLKVAKQKA